MTTYSTGTPTPAPRRRRRPWWRRGLVFLTVVVLVDALVGDSGLSQTIRARREHGAATARLRALQTENAGLAEQAQRLTWDPGTIEWLAREQFGLIRPGEILFVLTPIK